MQISTLIIIALSVTGLNLQAQTAEKKFNLNCYYWQYNNPEGTNGGMNDKPFLKIEVRPSKKTTGEQGSVFLAVDLITVNKDGSVLYSQLATVRMLQVNSYTQLTFMTDGDNGKQQSFNSSSIYSALSKKSLTIWRDADNKNITCFEENERSLMPPQRGKDATGK